MRKINCGARKQLGVHILDKVVGIYEEVTFISDSEDEKDLVQVKVTGPEARKSLSCSGAFEITTAGRQLIRWKSDINKV